MTKQTIEQEESKPRLIAEYRLPYIGTVRLFDNTHASIETRMYHGKYSSLRFRDVNNAINLAEGKTEDELYTETNKAVAQILLARKKVLLEELAQVEGVDSGVVSGSFSDNWMERYKQTGSKVGEEKIQN